MADELRSKLALGGNVQTRKEKKEESVQVVPLFKTYAFETIDRLKEVKRWRNKKHAQQWRNTIEKYTFPFIGDKPINEITREDVLNI